MPVLNLSWDEIDSLKHELQTARNEIIQSGVKFAPVCLNAAIDRVNSIVLKVNE